MSQTDKPIFLFPPGTKVKTARPSGELKDKIGICQSSEAGLIRVEFELDGVKTIKSIFASELTLLD